MQAIDRWAHREGDDSEEGDSEEGDSEECEECEECGKKNENHNQNLTTKRVEFQDKTMTCETHVHKKMG